MHWDHEPTPNPSQEGSSTASPVPLLGGVRGGFVADRFIGMRMPEAENKRQPKRIAAIRGHFVWLDEIFRETAWRST